MAEHVTAFGLSGILQRAEAQLANQGSVARVEVTGKGAIQVELTGGTGPSWYQWREREFEELKPERDRYLPLARRLADPDFAGRVCVLAYRPGKRLTLLDQSHAKPRILKGFRAGRLQDMIRKYETAHTAFSGRGVHSPEILDYDEEGQALAMTWQAGGRLSLSGNAIDLFHYAGEALRGFQDFATEEAFDHFSLEDELQVIDERARRLAVIGAELPTGWQDLWARIGDRATAAPPTVGGLVHRDLHDKQFVQQPSNLALLDFDLMARGDTALDAANFLAHLQLRNLQGAGGASQVSVFQCGKKFLKGLDRADEPGFWRRLRLYQATTFARLALLYLARPAWAGLVPDLLALSHRCLDDLDRIERILPT